MNAMTTRYGATITMKGGTATAWFATLDALMRWVALVEEAS